MRRSSLLIAVCLVGSSVAFASAIAAEKFRPTPGCKRPGALAELERSLKGERKIPYDSAAHPLRTCDRLQPQVTREMRKAGEPAVAVIVFDVTGVGRAVNQQVVGPKTPWTELSQETLTKKLFEPLVEGDIGITRVGVTMTFVAEFQDRTQSCGRVMAPVRPNLEIRICTAR
jgi:hypothetical protein